MTIVEDHERLNVHEQQKQRIPGSKRRVLAHPWGVAIAERLHDGEVGVGCIGRLRTQSWNEQDRPRDIAGQKLFRKDRMEERKLHQSFWKMVLGKQWNQLRPTVDTA